MGPGPALDEAHGGGGLRDDDEHADASTLPERSSDEREIEARRLEAGWSPAEGAHTSENVGKAPMSYVLVEIKEARSAAAGAAPLSRGEPAANVQAPRAPRR